MAEKSVNEQVAAACGFETYEGAQGLFRVETDEDSENFDNGVIFEPATDKAAALKALEAYCDKHDCCGCSWTRFPATPPNPVTHWISIDGRDDIGGDSFCTAICRAILAAEEKRDG